MAKTLKVWTGSAWEYVGPITAEAAVLYQATEPVGAVTGTVWVDSDVDVPSIDPATLATKAELDNAGLHPFLLMGA